MSGDLLDERRCLATSKRTGKQCGRFPSPGSRVCNIHGGAAPAVRAAAARRRAEAEASALYELVWDPSAEPVTNPIDGLQRLTGRLQHAADVLGARLEVDGLEGPAALAWTKVLRELRQALEGMQRLDIAGRHVELEQERATLVVAAFTAALNALQLSPGDRSHAVQVYLAALEPAIGGQVVAGEVEP